MSNNKSMAGVMIPMIRKMMPSMLSSQLVGVQPMSTGTGSIFNLKTRYYETGSAHYKIIKSWTAGRGRKMHRITVSNEVLLWLQTEYDQSNERVYSWWIFERNNINITDDMMMILRLRWAG